MSSSKRLLSSPRAETPLGSRHGLFSKHQQTWTWGSLTTGCGVVALVTTVLVLYEVLLGSGSLSTGSLKRLQGLTGSGASPDVLVMYVFSNTDPEYLENLKFFLREGVHPNDGCEYLFIVNRGSEEEVRTQTQAFQPVLAVFGPHLPRISTSTLRKSVQSAQMCCAHDAGFKVSCLLPAADNLKFSLSALHCTCHTGQAV